MSLWEIFYIQIIMEEISKHTEETGRVGLFMPGTGGGSAPLHEDSSTHVKATYSSMPLVPTANEQRQMDPWSSLTKLA